MFVQGHIRSFKVKIRRRKFTANCCNGLTLPCATAAVDCLSSDWRDCPARQDAGNASSITVIVYFFLQLHARFLERQVRRRAAQCSRNSELNQRQNQTLSVEMIGCAGSLGGALQFRWSRSWVFYKTPRRLCFARRLFGCLFVCLSVSRSVCLLATSRENY